MQLLLKRLRHLGAVRPRLDVDRERWRIGEVQTFSDARGHRLTIRALGVTPDHPPLAELYHPTVRSLNRDDLIVRGVEQVTIEGAPAAVVQDWCLRQPPRLDGRGLTDELRRDIDGWGSNMLAHLTLQSR